MMSAADFVRSSFGPVPASASRIGSAFISPTHATLEGFFAFNH
jgi:hypothetical protein